jgi:hypothetical protein
MNHFAMPTVNDIAVLNAPRGEAVGPIAAPIVFAPWARQRTPTWHEQRFGAPVSGSTAPTILGELPFAPSAERFVQIRGDPFLAEMLAMGADAAMVSYLGEMVCAYPRTPLVKGPLDCCDMWRGVLLERVVTRMLEVINDARVYEMPSLPHRELPFARVSLDGLISIVGDDGEWWEAGVEIKCPRRMKPGPGFYMHQLQIQMTALGLRRALFAQLDFVQFRDTMWECAVPTDDEARADWCVEHVRDMDQAHRLVAVQQYDVDDAWVATYGPRLHDFHELVVELRAARGVDFAAFARLNG